MWIIRRLLLIFVVTARAASAQNPDSLFQSRCASCHLTGNAVGAPLPETLRQMSWQAILGALEVGKMKPIGDGMSATEREAIAKFLGTADPHPMPPAAQSPGAPQQAPPGNRNGRARPTDNPC